ncbi:MAG TPA: protein translocase SEC61 complex subunit gamma [Candidatus Paceibacterota bacterium]|nr:protein translocase SEC61 complex subunit gamma [Candidatus Paceibacterota bacterium]
MKIKEIKEKFLGFVKKCIRVWHVLRKPTKEEFLTVAKVSAIGILIIGCLAFLISLIMRLVTK